MKKIMFNDNFGLTQSVLSKIKKHTRRIITCPKEFKGEYVAGFHVYKRQSDGAILEWPSLYDADESTIDGGYILPKYEVGEIVAIAQAYNDFYDDECDPRLFPAGAGWTNKMFVKASLMPHHIRITGINLERLQDISEDDCFQEGIEYDHKSKGFYLNYNKNTGSRIWLSDKSARDAYAVLIDKISGKGTWDNNPFVFVYKFELVD